MRSELHETATHFTAPIRPTVGAAEALLPSVVDAAFSDEAAPIATPRGSRREIRATAAPDAPRMAIDEPHSAAAPPAAEASDGALFRQLSRQLSLLEIQQQQIRRLLQQTERRADRPTSTMP